MLSDGCVCSATGKVRLFHSVHACSITATVLPILVDRLHRALWTSVVLLPR